MKEGGVDLASGVLVTTPLVSDSFCNCQGETTEEGLAATKIELSPREWQVSCNGAEVSAYESLKENEEHSRGDASTIGIGPGDTSLGKDAVSVSEDWAAGWDSLEELDAEELDADDTIFDSSIALGLKGKFRTLQIPP